MRLFNLSWIGLAKFLRPIMSRFAYVLLASLLCACAVKEPPTVLKQGSLPDGGNICRVAVLPFSNQSGYKEADDIFARVFVSELVNSGNYQVAQEGDVRKFLQQMQVLPNQAPDSEQMRAMADRLGVQVVISGLVTEMKEKSEYDQRLDPSLAVVIRVIEGDSGRTLWSTYSRREGYQYRKIMHFGLINSLTALSKHVSAEIVETWHKEGFHKCSEQ